MRAPGWLGRFAPASLLAPAAPDSSGRLLATLVALLVLLAAGRLAGS